MRSSVRPTSCLVAACLLPRAVLAASTNATIDDNYGDSLTGDKPTYSNDWNYGPDCPGCYIQPNKTRAYDQSWHDVTASPDDSSARNVSFSFNGTAIYIYGILPPAIEFTTTYVNVSVQLDGQVVGRFENDPTEQSGYRYNVTVYKNTSLEYGEHNVVITPRRDVNSSYFAFDWAQYTYDPDRSTTSATASSTATPTTTTTTSGSGSSKRSHSSVGPIVGGIVGGIAVIFLAVLAFIFWRRRTHRQMDVIEYGGAARGEEIEPANEPSNKPEPFVMGSAATEMHSRDSSLVTPVSAALTASAVASLPASNDGASRGPSLAATVSPTTRSPSAADSQRVQLNSGRRGKTAMQRAELSRQMREMEAQVAELRRRQSSRDAHSPSALPSLARPAQPTGGQEDVDLRRQIEALQLEVERLRATAVMDEPPPAYEESEGSSRR